MKRKEPDTPGVPLKNPATLLNLCLHVICNRRLLAPKIALLPPDILDKLWQLNTNTGAVGALADVIDSRRAIAGEAPLTAFDVLRAVVRAHRNKILSYRTLVAIAHVWPLEGNMREQSHRRDWSWTLVIDNTNNGVMTGRLQIYPVASQVAPPGDESIPPERQNIIVVPLELHHLCRITDVMVADDPNDVSSAVSNYGHIWQWKQALVDQSNGTTIRCPVAYLAVLSEGANEDDEETADYPSRRRVIDRPDTTTLVFDRRYTDVLRLYRLSTSNMSNHGGEEAVHPNRFLDPDACNYFECFHVYEIEGIRLLMRNVGRMHLHKDGVGSLPAILHNDDIELVCRRLCLQWEQTPRNVTFWLNEVPLELRRARYAYRMLAISARQVQHRDLWARTNAMRIQLEELEKRKYPHWIQRRDNRAGVIGNVKEVSCRVKIQGLGDLSDKSKKSVHGFIDHLLYKHRRTSEDQVYDGIDLFGSNALASSSLNTTWYTGQPSGFMARVVFLPPLFLVEGTESYPCDDE